MDPLASRSMIVEAAVFLCILHKPRGSLMSLSADEPLDVRHFISLFFTLWWFYLSIFFGSGKGLKVYF